MLSRRSVCEGEIHRRRHGSLRWRRCRARIAGISLPLLRNGEEALAAPAPATCALERQEAAPPAPGNSSVLTGPANHLPRTSGDLVPVARVDAFVTSADRQAPAAGPGSVSRARARTRNRKAGYPPPRTHWSGRGLAAAAFIATERAPSPAHAHAREAPTRPPRTRRNFGAWSGARDLYVTPLPVGVNGEGSGNP